jgi:ribosomal protein S18 acetylase RimI-like enzyme
MTCSCGPAPARAAGPRAAAAAPAAADGKVRMDLTTARSNHAAQALYESLGWVRDEVFLAYARRMPAHTGAGLAMLAAPCLP